MRNGTPGHVVLVGINARYRHTSFGLRCLVAALGERGERCAIRETTIKSDMVAFAEEVAAEAPALVGVGVYIWNVPQVIAFLKEIRRLSPQSVVVLGGPEVSYETDGQEVVGLADYVVTGEGETAFAELVDAMDAGKLPTRRILPGGLPPIETLPSPYGLYTDEDIAQRVIYVEASRGCPFKCQFCLSSLDQRVRQVDLERFFADLENLMERGARNFKFIDRTFNLRMDVSTAILRFFLERVHLGLDLHFEMIPDRLPDALRDLLQQFPPGVVQLEVGIQTFDIPTAARIERRQNYQKTETNLRFLRDKTDVHLHTDLIVGLPGEDLETFGEGFDRLIGWNPQEIQVGILKRLKGTPICQHDESGAMEYNTSAPYDILQTGAISADDMEEMKHFSRLWDRIANSGNFVESTPLIWGEGSAYAAFRRLTQFILTEKGRSHGIQLVELHRMLMAFLTTVRGLSESEVRPVLYRDYHRTPGRKTPRFLHLEGKRNAMVPVARRTGPSRQARHLGTIRPNTP